MKEIITIRIDPGIKEKLDQIAHTTRRSKSYLALEALREYIKLPKNKRISSLSSNLKKEKGTFNVIG